MKTKRFVSTLLALLLLCSLPLSAFADNIPSGTHEESTSGDWDTNDGTVGTNNGAVSVNNGTVGTNNGTVGTNKGTVSVNNGTVGTNNGTVGTNEGIVRTNNVIVSDNNGSVETNNGTVGTNNGGVGTNNDNARVGTNNHTVIENYGTVAVNNMHVANNGTAENNNNAKVGTNNGSVENNNGTVSVNNGTVGTNNGTVETNEITGKVTNYGGKVGTNYGTVTEVKGNDEAITWYGVQVVGENNNNPIRKDQGVDLDLTQFTKEGHVLTGYIQNFTMQKDKVTSLETPIPVNSTVYTADCPNVLTLIWQALSSGSGEVAAAAAADNGAADFGPGIYISINGHQYMLVAVVEDAYCLASVENYEAEELADLPALLASLLTEEQLGYVTGEAELLDEELTAYFFAGRGSHIVFSCDKGLIFS